MFNYPVYVPEPVNVRIVFAPDTNGVGLTVPVYVPEYDAVGIDNITTPSPPFPASPPFA
jgi:hypothetical protein